MPAEMPTEVNNHDVLGLVRRINRFIVELTHAASAGISEMTGHDITRLKTYLTAISTYKAWVIGQPILDLPETHPQVYALPVPPSVPGLDNDSVADILTLLGKLRDEMVAGQSGRYASGLNAHDAVRFDAIVAKVTAFLEDYVELATPLDLPESSPRDPGVAHGR